jgi:hypothetical protein
MALREGCALIGVQTLTARFSEDLPYWQSPLLYGMSSMPPAVCSMSDYSSSAGSLGNLIEIFLFRSSTCRRCTTSLAWKGCACLGFLWFHWINMGSDSCGDCGKGCLLWRSWSCVQMQCESFALQTSRDTGRLWTVLPGLRSHGVRMAKPESTSDVAEMTEEVLLKVLRGNVKH